MKLTSSFRFGDMCRVLITKSGRTTIVRSRTVLMAAIESRKAL